MAAVDRVTTYLAGQTVKILICFGTLLPIILAILFKFHIDAAWLQSTDVAKVLIFFFAVGAVLIVLWWGLCSEWDPILLLTVSVFLAIAGRVMLIAFIQAEPISDYATMWNYAQRVVEGGSFIPADSPQTKRTLAYLLPVTWVADGASHGYKIANLILGIATIGLTFLIGKTAFNTRVGAIGAALAALAPEPLAATGVPTHDVPGNFFLLAGLWVTILLAKQIKGSSISIWKIIILSLTLGLTITLTDFVRGTGLFLLIGWALYVAIIFFFRYEKNYRFCIILLVCMALPFVTNAVTKQSAYETLVSPEYSNNEVRLIYRWIAAYAGQESIGNYQDVKNIQPYIDALENNQLANFAINLFFSDLSYNYLQWPKKYARKSMRLFHLGNQHTDYFTVHENRRDKAGDIPAYHRWYNHVFSILLLIISAPAIFLFLMFERPISRAYLPLLVLSLMSTALIVLGEIQSHYMTPAWFILPLYFAWMVEKVRSRQLSIIRLRTSLISLCWFLLIAGVTAGAAGAIGLKTYSHSNGKILKSSDWNSSKSLADAFSTFSLRLHRNEMNDNKKNVSTELEIDGYGPYNLGFFVKGGKNAGGNCTGIFTIQVNQQRDTIERSFLNGHPELIKLSGYIPINGILSLRIGYPLATDIANSCEWIVIEYLSVLY